MPAQQPLAGQAQERVVLRLRPRMITLLSAICARRSFLPARARVQNHGMMTLMARSVARDSPSNGCGLGRRGEAKLQCHDQNSSCGGCRQSSNEFASDVSGGAVVNHSSSFAQEILRGQPMGGQRQAALRLVGRTKAVQAPEILWQLHGRGIFRSRATNGPTRFASIRRGGVVRGRQETAHAQQPRLQALAPTPRRPLSSRQQFGHALHGPDILFVTERAKKSLPKRLLPAGLARADFQFAGFALETDQRGLLQKSPPFGPALNCPSGAEASAAQGFPASVRAAPPTPSFASRSTAYRGIVPAPAPATGRRRSPARRPNDVQNDVGKGRVAIMLMPLPVPRHQIHFNIPGARLVLAELHDRPAKIRAGLVIPKTRMKHPHGLAIGRAQSSRRSRW